MWAIHFIQVKHVYREANGVAHRLAQFACFSSLDEFWINETPSIIEDVLYKDLCNCERGQRLSSPSLHS